MKTTGAAIISPQTITGGYSCTFYVQSFPVNVKTGDTVTDSTFNSYSISKFYNPGNPSQTNLTHLFSDGWTIELTFITNDVLPIADSGYDSTIESPIIPSYLPSVSWGCFLSNILGSIPAYNYKCDIAVESSGDPGSGTIEVGFYLVDFDGGIYRVEEIISTSSPITVRLYDINELDNNAPSSSLGYIYQAKRDSVIMSQAKFYRLDQSARDLANNIEKAVLWEHRGLELKMANGEYKNVTNLEVNGLEFIDETENGWVGGTQITGESFGGNKIIEGTSGFESHELDGGGNDVNSYIEWDNGDKTHNHRVEPKQANQHIMIKIRYQFPSSFKGLRQTGLAFKFHAKCSGGNSLVELVNLVDTDGIEYAITGKQVSALTSTAIDLTKAEIDNILNPITSSSSTSGQREWGTGDSGKLIYAKFKMSGDLGENSYLDSNNAFMYIE